MFLSVGGRHAFVLMCTFIFSEIIPILIFQSLLQLSMGVVRSVCYFAFEFNRYTIQVVFVLYCSYFYVYLLQFSVGPDGKRREPESNVLLVSIENMQYAVTIDVIHTVCTSEYSYKITPCCWLA
jgi:hypothetical protein